MPLLIHLERLEDEEEDETVMDDDDDDDSEQKKSAPKRNVSIDNYIAWGMLQVQ
jgi:hypothetical protein